MKLRIRLSFVCFVVIGTMFFCCNLLAQDGSPPPCCNHAPAVLSGSAAVESRIVVTDTALAGMGIDRTQFVDRLIALFMPDKQVSVVYSTSISLNPTALAEVNADGQLPEAVTVKQQYRVPRAAMRSEDIQALDHLSITDGVVSIAVDFSRSASAAQLP